MELKQSGDYIKALRQRLKLNQTKFAESIGITQTYLSYIEKGKRPLLNTLSKVIARKYKVSIAKEIEALQAQIEYLKRFR